MQRRRNAERPRSKKSPQAVSPHEQPIPPSPPALMLDNDSVSVNKLDSLPTADPRVSVQREQEQMTSAAPHQSSIAEQVVSEPSHTVNLVIPAETSMFDNLTRAVRSFYPPPASSPAMGTTQKRRPVSIGSFIGSGLSRKRGNASSLTSTSLSPLLTPLNVGGSRAHALPEATMEEEDRDRGSETLPQQVDSDRIIFSYWTSLRDEKGLRQRLLFLGYNEGFQIWDTSSLESLHELVNVKDDPAMKAPVFGAVISSHTISAEMYIKEAHVVASLLTGTKGSLDTEFLAYSLTSHSIAHHISIPGALHIEANEDIIAISSTRPPSILLISPESYAQVGTITTVSSHPVFSLSHRLLAVACPPPQEQERHLYANPGVVSRSPPQVMSPLGGAMKVGQGIFTGMKALSGMAIAATSTGLSDTPRWSDMEDQKGPAQWFSRSAPAAASFLTTSESTTPSFSPRRKDPKLPSPSLRSTSDSLSHEGSWVNIVDVKGIKDGHSNEEIHRFRVTSSKPVTMLHWSDSGTQLYASSSDGQTVSVFAIRPDASKPSKSISTASINATDPRHSRPEDCGTPWHIYDLHRGHSTATILAIATSHDSRWTVAATHRGTIHVFATNPYGGQPDIFSHMEGNVRNIDFMPPLSTSLVPLTRIKPTSSYLYTDDNDRAPMNIHFLTHQESLNLPALIAPKYHAAASDNHTPLPRADSKSRTIGSGDNFQDILVFNPANGLLELFRIVTDVIDTPTPHARLPPHAYTHSGTSPANGPLSALSRLIDRGQRNTLQAKDFLVASWSVRRASDWAEVRSCIRDNFCLDASRHRGRTNWLAQAELSTFSRSSQVLPPSIYLSHQFSFHSFLEDYDALLRSDRFVIPTSVIPVRREVVAAIYESESNDTFLEAEHFEHQGLSETSSRKQKHLDEPMAKAISDGLDYSQSSPPTYPMLPNGASLSSHGTRTLLDAIPIRRSAQLAIGLTEGVGEGLGKLRREIAKVKSPQLRARPDEHEQVLEDEELLDPQFNLQGDGEDGNSRMTSSNSGASIRTPPEDEAGDERDPWYEWAEEDQKVVEEAERFDEIYPAGVMDVDEEEGEVKLGQVKSKFGQKMNGK